MTGTMRIEERSTESVDPHSSPQQKPAEGPWLARLVLLASIWGMSFLFIKVGDEAFSPVLVALGRMMVGTATLLLILVIRGERLPHDVHLWRRLAIAALFFNSLPFALFAYGETRTTSVLAGIWNATTPLLTLLVAMATLPDERPTRDRITGLLIGFGGVLIVLGFWRGVGGHAFLGNLACLIASACYGVGFPYTRKYLSGRSESILVLASAQLVCGTVELAVVAPFVSTFPTGFPLKAAACICALGAFGTGIAYVLNYGLIRDGGATAASTVTYLVPLFATLVGVLILGEPLVWNQPLGAMVVLLGVGVSQGRLPRRLSSS